MTEAEAVERILHERFALFGINGAEIKEAAREIAALARQAEQERGR